MKIPQYMTISELLERLGFPKGTAGRESLRQQIYRWCETRTEARADRPGGRTRKAKLIEGIHWGQALEGGDRIFTRAALAAIRALRRKPVPLKSTGRLLTPFADESRKVAAAADAELDARTGGLLTRVRGARKGGGKRL